MNTTLPDPEHPLWFSATRYPTNWDWTSPVVTNHDEFTVMNEEQSRHTDYTLPELDDIIPMWMMFSALYFMDSTPN